MEKRKFECVNCGYKWEEQPCVAGGRHGYEIPCPHCGSLKKTKIAVDGSKIACGGGHHHGEHGCCDGQPNR